MPSEAQYSRSLPKGDSPSKVNPVIRTAGPERDPETRSCSSDKPLRDGQITECLALRAGTSHKGRDLPYMGAAMESVSTQHDALRAEQATTQLLEEIREKVAWFKMYLKPFKVPTFGLDRLLHAYLYASRIRVVVVLYAFLACVV